MMTKKRNPQDATLRNICALKKRVKSLEVFVAFLDQIVCRITDAMPSMKTGSKRR